MLTLSHLSKKYLWCIRDLGTTGVGSKSLTLRPASLHTGVREMLSVFLLRPTVVRHVLVSFASLLF